MSGWFGGGSDGAEGAPLAGRRRPRRPAGGVVYPLVRAAAGSHEIARTIERRETVMSWDDPAKVITEPGTFSLVSYHVDIANGGCGTYTGFLVPEFGAGRAASDRGEGPEVDPYDRSTPLAARGGKTVGGKCGTATRT